MKTDIPRRTIEEIITLYELENEINDIYVEGAFDKHFLEWYFLQNKINEISIYEINDIEIDDSEISEQFEKNNRDRIIYLIVKLNENVLLKNFKGLIDQDILKYTRGIPNIVNLLVTDFSCLEMYMFCKEVFIKVNKLSLGNKVKNINEFMEDIVSITRVLASICIYEKREKIGLVKVDFTKHIKIENERAKLNFDKYLLAILNKNSITAKFKEIRSSLEEIEKEILADDPRNYINGHQMISTTNSVLRKMHIISPQIDDDTVRKIIISSVELCILDKYDLFNRIKSCFKANIA